MAELVTTAAIHPNVIAGETPTPSPYAPASLSDLDKQHGLGQFLTLASDASPLIPLPTGGNRYDDLSVEFMDACVYLHAWLGDGSIHGIAEFPFARLYPVNGGLYNVSVCRLIDWSRVEDSPVRAAENLFWNQAPNAKFRVKIARHKTFEEAMDALARDPNF